MDACSGSAERGQKYSRANQHCSSPPGQQPKAKGVSKGPQCGGEPQKLQPGHTRIQVPHRLGHPQINLLDPDAELPAKPWHCILILSPGPVGGWAQALHTLQVCALLPAAPPSESHTGPAP